MQNLTNDELIAQLLDDAIPDEQKLLRGEAARRLIVCEELLKVLNKEPANKELCLECTECLITMFNGGKPCL